MARGARGARTRSGAEEAALAARRDEVRRRADYLRHVVSEIERAKLKPGEDEALEVEARRLSQAGALGEQAQRIADAAGGRRRHALGAAGRADRALGPLEKVDPAVAGWREMLDAAYANLAELARLAGDVRRGGAGGSRAARGSRAPARRRCSASPRSTARRSRRCSAARDASRGGARSAGHGGRRPAGARAPAAQRCRGRCSALRPRRSAQRRRRGVRPAGARGEPTAPAARAAGREARGRAVAAGRARVARAGVRQFTVQLNVGTRGAAARPGRVGRRAVPPDARAQGGAGPARRDRRRWCSTRWTRGSAARSAPRWAGAGGGGGAAPGAGDHASPADRRPRRPAPGGVEGGAGAASRPATCRRSTARIGWPSWRGCWGIPKATPRGATRRRCSARRKRPAARPVRSVLSV